jgi:hypothetical protein
MSWLYLASRSERDSEPVLVWPQLVATAKSAIVEFSVSPDRCDIRARIISGVELAGPNVATILAFRRRRMLTSRPG